MFAIAPELPADAAEIEILLDQAFGPGRLAKSSYAYRQRIERLWPLCLTARTADGRLAGTIRAWPLRIGQANQPAVLVGPVAVATEQRCHGIGATLVEQCLEAAKPMGHALALLVGDKPYYGRFGFVEAAELGIVMPRENPARVLVRTLAPATAPPSGLVQPWGSVRPWRIAA